MMPMKKQTPKKMLGPTLQEYELVPVTDPAEFATLDRQCRAAEQATATAERKTGKCKSSKGIDPGSLEVERADKRCQEEPCPLCSSPIGPLAIPEPFSTWRVNI